MKMKKEEFEFILQEGEGQFIEFKENFDAKDISKEMTAFANSQGGRIFLGIDDKGKIRGLEISNKIKSQVQDIARNCNPSINLDLESLGNILVINVKEGINKPYSCSQGFFLRTGTNSQKLSRDEIIELVKSLGKIKFDEQINEGFKFPDDFDENKLNNFLKNAGLSNVSSLSDVLINLSLAVRKEGRIVINNAGVLMFGKDIEKFIKQNFVYCTLFKGRERVDIIDRKEFKEDLLTNYFEGLNFLKKHLRLEYTLKGGGPRTESMEIPEEALKEALVNSIIHRDYFETGFGITVEVFDDRVEITNWGKLLFDKKELGKISAARNPLIFELFHRLNMVEKAGSGIGRIRRLAKEKGLKVSFETKDFFRVIFKRNLATPQATPQAELTELEQKIINIILKNRKISRLDITKNLGISQDTVKEYIKRLKDKKVLKRVGSTSAGYWEINKRKEDGK